MLDKKQGAYYNSFAFCQCNVIGEISFTNKKTLNYVDYIMNLEEEIKYGFTISKKRKAVWAIQLELLKCFLGICERYGLTYFASDGTLLGCVRHNGFIPWDDDIDIIMPRNDYEFFLRVATKELPPYYFLQSYKSEKNYLNGHIQIRDSRTTCFLKEGYHALETGHNCGIFIDIFPLDYVSDRKFVRKIQARRVWFIRYCCAIRQSNLKAKTFKMKLVKFAARAYNLFHSYRFELQKFNCPFGKKRKPTDTVAVITFAPGNEATVWKAKLFEKSTSHAFEDITLTIPENYDEVLKKEYGNYMEIPQCKLGGSMHTCYFDVEKSYKEYENISEYEFNQLFLEGSL